MNTLPHFIFLARPRLVPQALRGDIHPRASGCPHRRPSRGHLTERRTLRRESAAVNCKRARAGRMLSSAILLSVFRPNATKPLAPCGASSSPPRSFFLSYLLHCTHELRRCVSSAAETRRKEL